MRGFFIVLSLPDAERAAVCTNVVRKKERVIIATFQSLNVNPLCIRVLDSMNIVEAMPIQEQAIPPALEGKDMIAIAQTGTGKTLAFGLPGLTRLAASSDPRAQMLVLCPTRELAVQINDVMRPLARELRLRTACIFGGVNIRPQIAELGRHPSVIVATPGRLQDHINRKTVSFHHLQMLVLDEADRMLDMGFWPDIQRILSILPEKRQTLFFSATFPADIRARVLPLLQSPHHIEVTPESTPVEAITQGVYTVGQTEKAGLLTKLLAMPEVQSTLIFTRTKHRADRVSKMLKNSGFKAETIHGDRSQSQRQEALTRFKGGHSNILVATDIAARGIDVKGVTHVINYDIPAASEDYVHRIGRTARAHTTGTALTFASPGDEAALRAIEKMIGRRIGQHDWEGAVKLAERGSSSSSTSAHGGRPGQGGGGGRKYSGGRPGGQSGQKSTRPAGSTHGRPGSSGRSDFKRSSPPGGSHAQRNSGAASSRSSTPRPSAS